VKHRFESFGGIVASEEPPFLAFVDRRFMRELGLGESSLWKAASEAVGILSAPTEVHMAVTNACPVRCEHCYMGAGEAESGEMGTAALKDALREFAEMGVFHVALGGGEALARDDIFEIAGFAREIGLVPNLTVSGVLMTDETARRMTVFGQVNVSVDGVGAAYGVHRGRDLFETADRALGMLLEAGVAAGINCVLGRRNFEGVPELFAYARSRGASEIEFLRFKPSGRGAGLYEKCRTTFDQNVRLAPMLARLSEEHGVTAKVDCSFIPMICWHSPPPEFLEATATYGCEAGNVLLGARSDGSVCGCSFLPGIGVRVDELRDAWRASPGLESLRTWTARAPEPCRSCEYLGICKGGCHAVALHVAGSLDAPDPDCPRVVRRREEGGAR